jgi:CBS-domain-containing membrane protein
MMEIITVISRPQAGIKGESSREEAYGVLSGEDRLVRDITTREVVSVRSSMSLEEASNLCRDQKNKPILVVYDGEEPVYVMTERDLAHARLVPVNLTPSRTLHEFLNNRVAVRCREDAILADAIHEMVAYHTTHVPVLDLQGDLLGSLSLIDIIGALSPPAAEKWLPKLRGWSAISP